MLASMTNSHRSSGGAHMAASLWPGCRFTSAPAPAPAPASAPIHPPLPGPRVAQSTVSLSWCVYMECTSFDTKPYIVLLTPAQICHCMPDEHLVGPTAIAALLCSARLPARSLARLSGAAQPGPAMALPVRCARQTGPVGVLPVLYRCNATPGALD